MRRKVLAVLAVLALAVGAFVLLRSDPLEERRAEGQRLWQEAVWFPERRAFGDSVAPLEEVRRAGRGDDDVLFMLAAAYLFEGRHDRAFDIGSALSQRTPNHPGGHLLRAYVMSNEGTPEEAWAASQAALALLGGTASRDPLRDEIEYLGRCWRGKTALFMGHFEGAVEDLAAALDAHTGRGSTPPVDLVLSAVAAHKRMNEHDRGLAILDDALRGRPGQPSFLLQRAMLLADQQSDDAGPAFEDAARADPRNPTPLLKLAALDRLNGLLPSMYGRLLVVRDLIDRIAPTTDPYRIDLHRAELAAGFARYWLEVGRERRAAGEPEAAEEAFQEALRQGLKAVQLFPDCVRVHTVIRALGAFIDVPQEVLDASKRKLDAGHDPVPAIADAARTFC